LTGVFGAGAQNDAWRWVADGLVHIVASDAHNTRSRPLKLSAAFELVRGKLGEEKARALFIENPMAAFEGRELPHVPQLSEGSEAPRRKRFFFF
jgi:protein-tyrosine phosphatase